MKRIIVFLLFTFIVIGCEEKNDSYDEYNKKVTEELNSGVRNDNIFLGYTFGMTKNQFEKKTRELYKQKILYLNENGNYAYKMFLEKVVAENLEATFEPTYFQNKLFKLTVAVKDKSEFADSSSPLLIQVLLRSLFSKKYGYGWIEQKGLLGDQKNYILIQGNREIEIIEAIGEARIFYTDLIAKKEFDKHQQEKSDEDLEKTKSNL